MLQYTRIKEGVMFLENTCQLRLEQLIAADFGPEPHRTRFLEKMQRVNPTMQAVLSMKQRGCSDGEITQTLQLSAGQLSRMEERILELYLLTVHHHKHPHRSKKIADFYE